MDRNMNHKFCAELDDSKIIAEIINGDEIAENCLYVNYKLKLFNAISFLGIDDADIEDLIQETVIDAIENIRNGKFKDKGYLFAYMIRISKNKYLKQRKMKNRIKQVPLTAAILNTTNNNSNNKSPYKKVASKAYENLNKKCKELLDLRFYKELMPAKIIKLKPELVSTERISNQIDKCMKKLRTDAKQLLEEHYKKN